MNITQNWTYTNKYPKGAPIFFVSGKRVSLKKGFELTINGELGDAQYLKTWFSENGFIDSRAIGVAA